MKTTIRIPLDQFAYIELEDDNLTGARAIQIYKDYVQEFNASNVVVEGLPQRDWNRVLDRYLQEKGMTGDDNAQLGKAQAWLIHEIDKAKARLSTRESEVE